METVKFQSINKVIELISVDRERTNILRKPEQKALAFLVQRIPSWISSDMLTGIGFGGNILTFFSFLLAAYIATPYLLLGVLGYAISWFGDSLDGRIAYYRHKERKWYGFSLDITVDWLGVILMGLGFVVYTEGPWEIVGFGFVVLYGWEMITTSVRYKVSGKYSIDSGLFGPTEVRIIISLILLGEVLFKGSIQYVSLLVTVILLVMNIIDTGKLLKLANEYDNNEKKKNKYRKIA
jgi:phosphatidylglycerophosphate synthase